MSEFSVFLKLGFDHISDLQAYDHMLFVTTLCAVYRPEDWRKIALLVTAFTVGHSVTLALSALDVIRVPVALVELLIPFTIFLTALYNVSGLSERTFSVKLHWNYALALFFGLIHGMGFANYFRGLFGDMGSVVKPLLAFNLGIELGQLLIVAVFFGFYLALRKIVAIEHRSWNQFISGAGAGVAVTLILKGMGV